MHDLWCTDSVYKKEHIKLLCTFVYVCAHFVEQIEKKVRTKKFFLHLSMIIWCMCVIPYFYFYKKCIIKKELLGDGLLAQLVEHFPFKEGVIGSNPIQLTKKGNLISSKTWIF